MYQPIFRNDVTLQGPTGRIPANPRYCLDPASVAALITLMQQKTGFPCVQFLGPPQSTNVRFGGPYSLDQQVPWLQFMDSPSGNGGTQINAAILADYFNHGYPESYALNAALREYQFCAYDQGFGGPPPTTPVTA